MPVRFFNRDPNGLFTVINTYTKTEVDVLFSDITSTGITQSALTYAVEDFISQTEIESIISDYTTDFISENRINELYSNEIVEFRTEDEINVMLSAETDFFLNEDEINVAASAATDDEYYTGNEVYDTTYSEMEITQDYWHPPPWFHRYLNTDASTYILAANKDSTKEMIVSGNTYWDIIDGDGEGSAPPSSDWFQLSRTTGTTTHVITITATTTNNTGSRRQQTIEFNALQIAGVPFQVVIEQNYQQT